MDKLITKVLRLAKKADPRQLSRRQAIKLTASALAVYLVVIVVNALVLAGQINSNDAKTAGIRETLDAMSLNLNLGSRIVDGDLRSQKAIGRVGAYYLT